MAEPKSFPALERCVELTVIGVLEYGGDPELQEQARAELEKARELLRLSKILASEISSPEFDAAIAACQPGKETASE